MSYPLVLPRDFFNQSKLLKCLGRLSLKVLDGELHRFNVEDELEDEQGFEIRLSEDGHLYCANYRFSVNQDLEVEFCQPYNDRGNFPLLFQGDDLERVMDEDGEFTQGFLDFLAKLFNGDSNG